ncbi:MAG: hypothetical protein K9L29_04015 [Spirochaetales bacterium]|nr:hypothetical protein [Spirochaetales bacterium]
MPFSAAAGAVSEQLESDEIPEPIYIEPADQTKTGKHQILELHGSKQAAAIRTTSLVSLTAPRPEGSVNEQVLVRIIQKNLKDAHIPYNHRSIGRLKDNHSFSSIIEAEIRGIQEDTLVIVAPLNHRTGAKENRRYTIPAATALNLALRLGSKKSTGKPPPINVKILFAGAEFETASLNNSGQPRSLLGSRTFLEGFFPESTAAVVYLDIAGVFRKLDVSGGGGGIVPPLWLVRDLAKSLTDHSLSFSFNGSRNQLRRFPFSEEDPVTEPFLSAGFPAIRLSETPDGAEAQARAADDHKGEQVELSMKLTEALDSLIGSLDKGIPRKWDKNYLTFKIFGRTVFISEYWYIAVFLLLIAITLALVFSFPGWVTADFMHVIRHWWKVGILVGAFFVINAGVALLASLLPMADPQVWTEYTGYLVLFKTATSSAVLLALAPLLARLRFPPEEGFWGYSAGLLLAVLIPVYASGDITFAYYIIWAFFLVSFSNLIKIRWFSFVLMLASPLLIVQAGYDMVNLEANGILRVVLFSPIAGNILVSTSMLPFLFLLIRIWLRHHKEGRSLHMMVPLTALLVLSASIYFLTLDAKPSVENKTEKAQLTILPETEAPFTISGSTGEVLGHRIVSIHTNQDLSNIDSDHQLIRRRLMLTLSGETSFNILRSPVPFQMGDGNRSAVLLFGHNPPVPLQFRLLIDGGGQLTASGRFYLDYTENRTLLFEQEEQLPNE